MKNAKTKNKNQFIRPLILMLVVFSLSQCNSEKTNSASKESNILEIYSAASLRGIMNEAIEVFTKEYPVEVRMNYASSGTLARQIEQGGYPDIYVSANKKWAKYVDSLGFFIYPYSAKVSENELVLITYTNSPITTFSFDSIQNMLSLLQGGRLALGDPAHVPAGQYAKQALEHYGIYEDLKSHLLPTKDVASALTIVEFEECELGIVYKTDAMKSEKVRILASFPELSHEPIVYIAGVCKANKRSTAFYDFLHSDKCRSIWNKHGFN